MHAIPVIAIFDIGKTNKKFLLFNEDYQIVYEHSEKLVETKDEDGYPCEDISELSNFIFKQWNFAQSLSQFIIKAVNFSAYGASFVYLDEVGKPVAPIYNYLKPYPVEIEQKFLSRYGSAENISFETGSPWLGSLNSGMQVYRFKYEHPEKYSQTRFAVHLPQFLSSLLNHQYFTEFTSIGCHTAIWNFSKMDYHHWIKQESIDQKFPVLVPSGTVSQVSNNGGSFISGIGLHDSSAALIPYLLNFNEPFVLLSTGTWCISLNPFNQSALTIEELKNDCLVYLSYNGHAVKASRLFAGKEHENGVEALAKRFEKPLDYYQIISYTESVFNDIESKNLLECEDYSSAYHWLIKSIVDKQVRSIELVIDQNNVRRIFVDGGFSQNELFMKMLSKKMSGIRVFAARVPQATALGAALVIHDHWNNKSIPGDLVELIEF